MGRRPIAGHRASPRGAGRAVVAGSLLLLFAGCAWQSELAARDQELTLTRRQLQRAEEEGKALAARIATLERALADLTAARARLEGERAELGVSLEKLQGENRELHQALRARADEQARRISELIERNRALEVQGARFRLLAEERQQQMQDLQGQLERAREARAAVEREVGRLQTVLEQQQAEVARLTATYATLVQDLRKEIEAGEIQVTQYRDLLTVNLVDKILFDSGSIVLKPRGLEVLQRVGKILRGVERKEIRIEGHTDNVPIGAALAQRFPTNWELSTARATAVARFLQEQVGIAPEKLAATGYAQFRSVASNDDEEGRRLNRRIEIILAPLPLGQGGTQP